MNTAAHRLFFSSELGMKPDDLRSLLEQVQAGNVSVDAALQGVQAPPSPTSATPMWTCTAGSAAAFPKSSSARARRPNGSRAWSVGSSRPAQDCLATRVSAEQAAHLAARFPAGGTGPRRPAPSGCRPPAARHRPPSGRVVVITAGTSDLPVAQEAVVTAQALGCEVKLIADVGVAGIHRLLRHREQFAGADAIVVVAGMDGALPSVVGGLVDCPVIAVPTSIGYGAAFGGVAPLLDHAERLLGQRGRRQHRQRLQGRLRRRPDRAAGRGLPRRAAGVSRLVRRLIRMARLHQPAYAGRSPIIRSMRANCQTGTCGGSWPL